MSIATEYTSMSQTMTLQGWHSRAVTTPYPDPHSFTPTSESLILTVLLNHLSEPEGISLALFAEPLTDRIIVVDATGRVSFVAPTDFDSILSLANRALALPDTTWEKTWVIKHDVTCQPNHRIFIPQTQVSTPRSLKDLKQIRVYGFSETKKELCYPIDGYHELPHELWELTGLLLEARKGAGYGGRRDELVLDKVRSVVSPLFRVPFV